MEIPIAVAVRVCPDYSNNAHCVEPIEGRHSLSKYNNNKNDEQQQQPQEQQQQTAGGFVKVKDNQFPVTHALPLQCCQDYVYMQCVWPMLAMFFEGFDVSVVTYGQKNTGKSYTMMGPGFDCSVQEQDQGIVQRFVREIFAQLSLHQHDRSFVINIGWIEIVNNEIHDLLGVGTVPCTSVTEVFHWLKLGHANRYVDVGGHGLFTLTLELQWITSDGLLQHRLSTASFCDLYGTERILLMNGGDQQISVPKNLGLQALERIVTAVADQNMMYNGSYIDYGQSTLTSMLKDSFGGRAQTVLILCVSPLESDLTETVHNLQFAFKAQCIRNFVVLNTYSDNNTVAHGQQQLHQQQQLTDQMGGINTDGISIQYAASQWLKLVANAEGLFNQLIVNKSLNDGDRERIEEWMYLKQECEDCLSSGELNHQRLLGPIQEEQDETSEPDDEDETSCVESDSEVQNLDLEDKISTIMDNFHIKTDILIRDKYTKFIKSHPAAVLLSQDSFKSAIEEQEPAQEQLEKLDQADPAEPAFERRRSTDRRKSIQPGGILSLSSIEIEMLNKVAQQQKAASASDDLYTAAGQSPRRNNQQEQIQNELRKLSLDFDATQSQMKELEHTIGLKREQIANSQKFKSNDTRAMAKRCVTKKKAKLKAEYEKTKKQLAKAVVGGRDKSKIDRLEQMTTQIERRLHDLDTIKYMADEFEQKSAEHKKSLKVLEKQHASLSNTLQKLKSDKTKLEKLQKAEAATKVDVSSGSGGNLKKIKDVQSRICHLDQVLKVKADHLHQSGKNDEEKKSLHHEICNLRKTRNHLVEERISLDSKLKKEKQLTHKEDRKLLECDEAIVAIDAAIEFKYELIDGRKTIDTDERLQRDEGEKMLMRRLNNLSLEEMRTLLYKYFQKVIDITDASRKLEHQLMSLERERDKWEWRSRVLNNSLQQARLEGASQAAMLQHQQEAKVALMLRHLAEETSANSSLSDHLSAAAALSHQHNLSDSDFNFKQLVKSNKHAADLELCPPLGDNGQLTKYKPLDKFKERESKNKLFAKLQVLTRYHSGSGNSAGGGGSSSDKRGNKVHDASALLALPEQHLRQLQQSGGGSGGGGGGGGHNGSGSPVTRVTREKNKIIIQQGDERHHN